MLAKSSDLAIKFHQPPFQHFCCVAGRTAQNGANIRKPEPSVAIGTNLQQPRKVPLAVAAVVAAAALRRAHQPNRFVVQERGPAEAGLPGEFGYRPHRLLPLSTL